MQIARNVGQVTNSNLIDVEFKYESSLIITVPEISWHDEDFVLQVSEDARRTLIREIADQADEELDRR